MDMKTSATLFLVLCLLLPAGMLGEEVRLEASPPVLYDSYFDDAVFVGDSVLKQLAIYQKEQRSRGNTLLGQARFLSAAKYTLHAASLKAQTNKTSLHYQGRAVTLTEGLLQMEAGKVVMMLGLNDHAGNRLDKDIARFERTIDNVREALPGVTFIALSLSPVARNRQSKTLTQQNLDAFNRELQALCERKEVPFIDIAILLKNDQGYLNLDYSNDKWVHLNDRGLLVVVEALRSFAREQHQQGAWQMQDRARP